MKNTLKATLIAAGLISLMSGCTTTDGATTAQAEQADHREAEYITGSNLPRKGTARHNGVSLVSPEEASQSLQMSRSNTRTGG